MIIINYYYYSLCIYNMIYIIIYIYYMYYYYIYISYIIIIYILIYIYYIYTLLYYIYIIIYIILNTSIYIHIIIHIELGMVHYQAFFQLDHHTVSFQAPKKLLGKSCGACPGGNGGSKPLKQRVIVQIRMCIYIYMVVF